MPTTLPDDQLCIRPMQAEDVPAALQLTIQAGWNQTPGDWQRMLHLEPAGCLVAMTEGRLVGTTVCCTFDGIAWLALVLVDVAFRDRGIGRRLVQAGLKYADECGIRTVRLDATPLGRPVYERLGFQPQFELSRWGGIPTGDHAVEPGDHDLTSTVDPALLIAMDQQATGTNRAKLLQRLFSESAPAVAMKAGTVAAFLTRRPGRLSTQIGPCSGSPDAAAWLLQRELRAQQGQPTIIDIPNDRTDLNAIAEQAGLTVQRPLLRMYRGARVSENQELYQISSGAELG